MKILKYVTGCVVVLAGFAIQGPGGTLAKVQPEPIPESKNRTDHRQRDLLASVYVRKWAEAHALSQKSALKIASMDSVPVFREDFDDHYVEYFAVNPELRAVALEAAVDAELLKQKLVRMGADAAPALASARFSPQSLVRLDAANILDQMGSKALETLKWAAENSQSPNRITAYVELRNRFPLAEINSNNVSTAELLELLKVDSAAGHSVIQELATRRLDSALIIPVLLGEQDHDRIYPAVMALCYLGASSQDLLSLIERGLIQSPTDSPAYLDAAISLLERGEITESEIRTMVSRIESHSARNAVDNELTHWLSLLRASEFERETASKSASLQELLHKFSRKPFSEKSFQSPSGAFRDLAPEFHLLIDQNADTESRIEMAKVLVDSLEGESTTTKLRAIPSLQSLGSAAWPLAPLMVKLVQNKNRDVDDLILAGDAIKLIGAMGEGDFPERAMVLSTLANVLSEPPQAQVKPPATCKQPDDYRDWYGIVRYRAIEALGRLKPAEAVIESTLRPLLRVENSDNRERRRVAESILSIKGYDDESIKTLRSLAGGGVFGSISSPPMGLTKSDQVEIRQTIEDWTAKHSGKTVDLLVQRLVTNSDGPMEAERIISALGEMGSDARGSIPVLERALICTKGHLRGAAVISLAKIDPTNPQLKSIVPELLQAAEFNVRQFAQQTQSLIQK